MKDICICDIDNTLVNTYTCLHNNAKKFKCPIGDDLFKPFISNNESDILSDICILEKLALSRLYIKPSVYKKVLQTCSLNNLQLYILTSRKNISLKQFIDIFPETIRYISGIIQVSSHMEKNNVFCLFDNIKYIFDDVVFLNNYDIRAKNLTFYQIDPKHDAILNIINSNN